MVELSPQIAAALQTALGAQAEKALEQLVAAIGKVTALPSGLDNPARPLLLTGTALPPVQGAPVQGAPNAVVIQTSSGPLTLQLATPDPLPRGTLSVIIQPDPQGGAPTATVLSPQAPAPAQAPQPATAQVQAQTTVATQLMTAAQPLPALAVGQVISATLLPGPVAATAQPSTPATVSAVSPVAGSSTLTQAAISTGAVLQSAVAPASSDSAGANADFPRGGNQGNSGDNRNGSFQGQSSLATQDRPLPSPVESRPGAPVPSMGQGAGVVTKAGNFSTDAPRPVFSAPSNAGAESISVPVASNSAATIAEPAITGPPSLALIRTGAETPGTPPSAPIALDTPRNTPEAAQPAATPAAYPGLGSTLLAQESAGIDPGFHGVAHSVNVPEALPLASALSLSAVTPADIRPQASAQTGSYLVTAVDHPSSVSDPHADIAAPQAVLPATLPPAGPPLQATVIAQTSAGQPLLTSSAGAILVNQPVTAPIGTTVTLQPLQTLTAAVAATGPAILPPIGPAAWPALQQTIASLDAASPQAAAMFRGELPQLDADFGPALASFLTPARPRAIASGHEQKIDMQDDDTDQGPADIKSLAARLLQDVASTAHNNASVRPGGWFSYPVPFMVDANEIGMIQLYVRRQVEPEEQKQDLGQPAKLPATRFLVEIHPSALGAVQLDGLLRKQPGHYDRLDLVVRTETPLSKESGAEMNRLFDAAMGATGLNGTLAFQAGRESMINPASSSRTDLGKA